MTPVQDLPRWKRWARQAWEGISGISIQFKLLGMVLAVTLVLGWAIAVQVRAKIAQDLRQSLAERGVAIARDLAEDATDLMLTQNIFGLYQELRVTLETNPDVRYVFILDPQDQVVAHSFPHRLPPDLLTVNRLPAGAPWQVQILETNEGLITDVAVPIFDGKLGTVRLGLSHRRVNAAIAEATRRVMWTTLVMLVVGGVAVTLLTRVLTRPIFDLVEAARAVGRGDLSVRPRVRMRDEIGELTATFNAMVEDLARFRDELVRQNRELAALNAVARALAGSRSMEEGLTLALESTLAALECEAGWIVLRSEDGGKPVLAAHKGLSPAFVTHETKPDIPPCRCYDILNACDDWRQPIVRQECPRLRRALERGDPEARFEGHLSVPLVAHGHPLGTLNLAIPEGRPFTPEAVALAAAIGHQVGIAVEAERQRRRVIAELEQRERLRAQLVARVLSVQEEERRRIARELHDEAGQALTSLMVGLRLLEREADRPEAVVQRAAELRRLTDSIMENLHRLAMDLRPASLDHLGLVPALRQYTEEYQARHGIRVQFEAVGLDGVHLSPQVETAVYRIVQEALTNVARHARASQVDVLLERRGDRVVIVVEDDGVGFDPALAERPGHVGLFSMRERAEMLGGTFMIESAPGRGTTLYVEVPYGHSSADRR